MALVIGMVLIYLLLVVIRVPFITRALSKALWCPPPTLCPHCQSAILASECGYGREVPCPHCSRPFVMLSPGAQLVISLVPPVLIAYGVAQIVPIIWFVAIPFNIVLLVGSWLVIAASPELNSPARVWPGKPRSELIALARQNPSLAQIFFFRRARGFLWIATLIPLATGCMILAAFKKHLEGFDYVIFLGAVIVTDVWLVALYARWCNHLELFHRYRFRL